MNIDEAIKLLNSIVKVNRHLLQGIENQTINQNEIQAIETLINKYNKERENINKVLGLIFEYGQIDGDHHKAWVIDQIVRALTEDDYDKWVESYEYDEETGNEYEWDIGIAP